VPLVVFLAPVGTVDPEYVDFWSPWPAQLSFHVMQALRTDRLARRLHEEGFSVVDLREVLEGVPGTYRLTDAHWTEKGHELVAERVLPEVRRIVRSGGQ
jgi:hypothetical protein